MTQEVLERFPTQIAYVELSDLHEVKWSSSQELKGHPVILNGHPVILNGHPVILGSTYMKLNGHPVILGSTYMKLNGHPVILSWTYMVILRTTGYPQVILLRRAYVKPRHRQTV